MRKILLPVFLFATIFSFAQDKLRFVSPLNISTSSGEGIRLEWGIADDAKYKQIDSVYGEFDLGPWAASNVFDARWHVDAESPALTRRIVIPTNSPQFFPFEIRPGANDSANLIISWKKSDIPDRNDRQKNPFGLLWFLKDAEFNGAKFYVDMKSGKGASVQGIELHEIDKDSVEIVVSKNALQNLMFVISAVTTSIEENFPANFSSISPNPIDSHSGIKFFLEQDSRVAVRILDLHGNSVMTLADRDFPSGENIIPVDAEKFSSGVYFCELIVNGKREVKKFCVMR